MTHNPILEFLGFKYVLNTKSKEIHNVKNLHKNCNFESLKHGKYISKRKMQKLTKDVSKLCRWCNKKKKQNKNI